VYTTLNAIAAVPVLLKDLPACIQRELPVTNSCQSWKIHGGIRRLAQELANPLEILQSMTLTKLNRSENSWTLEFKDSAHGDDLFDILTQRLVFTIPWPQVLDLLKESELIDLALNRALTEIPDYERCIVGLFETDMISDKFADQHWFEPIGSPVVKLIRGQSGMNGKYSLTVLAQPDWSLQNLDSNPPEILLKLQDAASELLEKNLQPTASAIHRWKYSKLEPSPGFTSTPIVLSHSPFLMVAGEAFGYNPEFNSGILASQNSAKLASKQIISIPSGI
jgi:predicted NAD/FAD-dependent oxidoreductase